MAAWIKANDGTLVNVANVVGITVYKDIYSARYEVRAVEPALWDQKSRWLPAYWVLTTHPIREFAEEIVEGIEAWLASGAPGVYVVPRIAPSAEATS